MDLCTTGKSATVVFVLIARLKIFYHIISLQGFWKARLSVHRYIIFYVLLKEINASSWDLSTSDLGQ